MPGTARSTSSSTPSTVGALEGVLAVAEEGEVPVGQPGQQLAGLAQLVGVERRRVVCEALRRSSATRSFILAQSSTASRTSRSTRWTSSTIDAGSACRRRLAQPVDLDVHPRLAHGLARRRARAVGDRRDRLQLAGDVAHDVEAGVHDEVDVAQLAAQLHRQAVDEERHVVDDDLDHRVAAGASSRARPASG